MDKKGLIRKKALELRDGMSREERHEKSSLIIEKLISMPLYQEADNLLVYVNYKSEVETTGLIEHALKAGKAVYCPKVEGEEMAFYQITDMGELLDGYRGIKEPKGSREKLFVNLNSDEKSVVIMPGSAFDRERNRIGYGKGYYDKYIEKHPELYMVAICFDCQLQEKIPADIYDKKPNLLRTESSLYR